MPVKMEYVEEAISEATRFIKRARALINFAPNSKSYDGLGARSYHRMRVLRASKDLSDALITLRRKEYDQQWYEKIMTD